MIIPEAAMTGSLTEKFCGLTDKINSCKLKKNTYIIAFAAYIILLSAIAAFHEPWFDEAQAWQIAKCASFYDMLFTVPHYEGHPPLWYFLLAPFAKTGMPYEFSLSLVNIIFSAAAMWILMFRTKLPDLMRLTLPFTYFFFYQYGVISRPYSVMCLAFMLCAVFYREKSVKPVRMVLALALLCSTSAYGLAAAGGICIVWLIEEWRGKSIFRFIKDFIRTKAFFSLLGLLIFAAAELMIIMPEGSATAINSLKKDKNIFSNMFYTFFVLPYDATVGSVIAHDALSLDFKVDFSCAVYFLMSALIVFLLILFGRKHRCAGLLFIPFLILPPVLASVLMFAHHTGIITVFLVFWLCVCFDGNKPVRSLGKYDSALHCIFTAAGCVLIIVQIFWTVTSSAADIRYNYSTGREMAEYIKENGLENSKIMSSWYTTAGSDGETYNSFNSSGTATVILPYFDGNIFSNFNWGNDSMGYSEHKDTVDPAEYEQTLERFRSLGAPEYIFGSLSYGSGDISNVTSVYHYIVKDVEFCMIYKGNYVKQYAAIYKFDDPNTVSDEVKPDEGTD